MSHASILLAAVADEERAIEALKQAARDRRGAIEHTHDEHPLMANAALRLAADAFVRAERRAVSARSRRATSAKTP